LGMKIQMEIGVGLQVLKEWKHLETPFCLLISLSPWLVYQKQKPQDYLYSNLDVYESH
jgi:hypothetical protein